MCHTAASCLVGAWIIIEFCNCSVRFIRGFLAGLPLTSVSSFILFPSLNYNNVAFLPHYLLFLKSQTPTNIFFYFYIGCRILLAMHSARLASQSIKSFLFYFIYFGVFIYYHNTYINVYEIMTSILRVEELGFGIIIS